MRDHHQTYPVLPEVPEIFVRACESIFEVPMDESRMFVCRSWVSKPLAGMPSRPSPACFVISAPRLDDARDVAVCMRGILEYVYLETRDGRLSNDEVNAIISTLQKRAYLLSLVEAILLYEDVGVPVYHGYGLDIGETLVMPLLPDVGFVEAKITNLIPKVPNKW